jgi:hypothetical protein
LRGKDHLGAACFHRRAPHCRGEVAGPAPPRPAAFCRPAPSPLPRRPPVEYAVSFSASWHFSHGVWSTPSPYPPCAAARRWPAAAARARASSWSSDPDPTDRIRPARSNPQPPVQTRLDLAVLQGNPHSSLVSQAGPPTLEFSLRLGPVFLVLALEI